MTVITSYSIHYTKLYDVALFAYATESPATNELGSRVTNGLFQVLLPPSAESNILRMAEWSTNLKEWEAVARDYGAGWENTFPHGLSIGMDGAGQLLADPPGSPARFYRATSTTTSGLGNTNSVARFLQQATFGPTRSLIAAFPGIGDPSYNFV